MQKVILVYGLIAALIIAVISSMYWHWGDALGHSNNPWFGYLVMLLGLSFIYVAIKQHKEHNLGGVISFAQGFYIGFWISVIASLFYIAAWEFYYQLSDQSFLLNYQQAQVATMQAAGHSAEEIAQAVTEMNDFAKRYDQLYFRMLITAVEILPVGVIISIICGLIHKNKPSKNQS